MKVQFEEVEQVLALGSLRAEPESGLGVPMPSEAEMKWESELKVEMVKPGLPDQKWEWPFE